MRAEGKERARAKLYLWPLLSRDRLGGHEMTHGNAWTIVAAALMLTAALGATGGPGSAGTVPDACKEEPENAGVDILFAFDLTGSMTEEIDSAKAEASDLLDDLEANLSDARYGVASFMDYPGTFSYPGYTAQYGSASAGDYPWSLDQGLTTSTSAVDAAIQGLTLGFGADGPESYSRVFLEAAELSSWRSGAEKILVMWGDNVPHDDDFDGNNFGLDPGRDATEGGGDDIDFQDVVAQMATAGVRVMTVDAGGGYPASYYQYAADQTGGAYTQLNDADALADIIVEFVKGILRNDDTPPHVDITLPEPGHLYVDGVDQGPSTARWTDRATLIGDTPFTALAGDNCLLENVSFSTQPDVGWMYSENASSIATSPFPASTAPAGNYTLNATAVDWVNLRGFDEAPFEVLHLSGEALARDLWAGTTTPESVEAQSPGAHRIQAGHERVEAVRLDLPTAQARATGLTEEATVELDRTEATAHGFARIERLELLGGSIVLEGLMNEAEARWDVVQGTTSWSDEATIANLTILGSPIQLTAPSSAVTLPLPNGGELVLFERDVSSGADGITYRSSLAHAYLPAPYARHEIVVGEIVLQATDRLDGIGSQRLVTTHDDARSGRDAGSNPGDGIQLGPGLYDGGLPGDDTLDVYTFELGHGDKIEVDITPALRAIATGGTAHVNESGTPNLEEPGLGTASPSMSAALQDPDGDLRALPLFSGALPMSLEINADEPGTWSLWLSRSEGAYEAYNYSMAVAVTPVPLLPQNDALSLADAPAVCDPNDGDIPAVGTGQWPGVVRDDDFVDVYRFEAEIGDLITASLKPGETEDGVDMALALYDRSCQLLERADTWGPYVLKGLPEMTTELPSQYTGSYFLAIERINGVGNHQLTLSIQDPQPGIPTNDAGTGQDAPTSHEDATAPPPPVFQGTLTEGDPGDAYVLALDADRQTVITVEMSAFSEVEVRVLTPSGGTISPTANLQDGHYAFAFDAPEDGLYGLEIVPASGGGEYMVAYSQLPVSVQA